MRFEFRSAKGSQPNRMATGAGAPSEPHRPRVEGFAQILRGMLR